MKEDHFGLEPSVVFLYRFHCTYHIGRKKKLFFIIQKVLKMLDTFIIVLDTQFQK